MVKETVSNDEYVELSSLEDGTCCSLNILTDVKSFFPWEKMTKERAEGFYHYDGKTFFALVESRKGPIIYYNKKVYPLTPDLHIELKKDARNENRVFSIKEYDICVEYKTSPYIGFDVWSGEEDVDLFYQIFMNYKKEEYYKEFTR